MAILMDRRPTLASWPKRIYAWPELPEIFHPALEDWRSRGLPPGNVTYIPRVNQYAGSPEFATAWLGDELLIQTALAGSVQVLPFSAREVGLVDYYVQLLRCTLTITLDGPRAGIQGSFSYNKTKEDQLLPILNLALGSPALRSPPVQHPGTPALEQLRRDSYAMYNISKLCYRFGDEIQGFLWLMGRNRGLARLNRVKPECFAACTERGIAWIHKDFYGTRMICIRWEHGPCLRLEEDRGQAFLCLDSSQGPAARFFLPPGQRERAEALLPDLLSAAERAQGQSDSNRRPQ